MKKLTKKELAEQKQRQLERDEQQKIRNKLRKINEIKEYDKRMKAILKAYDNGHHDLFNWCEDYKTFMDKSIYTNVTSMVEYILKKSYDDRDAPLTYDDFNLNIIEYERLRDDLQADENLLTRFIEWYKDNNNFTELITKEEINDRVDDDELKEFLDSENILEDYEVNAEVYEWWIIGDPLLYRLSQAGDEVINERENIWGRQTSGQLISMDGCCIHAFINPLRETYGKKNGKAN